jgi:hypothetical protein
MASSEFHLFALLKEFLGGQKLDSKSTEQACSQTSLNLPYISVFPCGGDNSRRSRQE